MPGLQFFKLDLHTHTPASKCYLHKDQTADQIVQAALEQGLDAIAITDHNTAEWIDQMNGAADETPLVIFPGVEISMSEGFHLVALFDPSADQKHVESFLGAINIKPEDHGKQEALCTKFTTYEVIKIIHEHNGLAILAHIDAPKGAFFEHVEHKDDGKIRVPVNVSKLFNEAKYNAVECAEGRLPDGFDEAHQIKKIPATYQASDNPDSDKPTKHSLSGLGNTYSWFHMEQVNIEGLRQCFADPEVRICLMDTMEEYHYPKIVSMKIGSAGFLRYQNVPFHPGLNCIIGGKGVGKSIAIEFLRFVLAQPSSDPGIASDHLGKLEKRLIRDNPIEVVYELADGTQYKIEKIYRGKQQGGDYDLPSADVSCTNISTGENYAGDIPSLFPILAYSQTEVIKISESKQAQLDLIDNFIDTRTFEQEVTGFQKLLNTNDVRLDEALQARGRLDECQREIDTLTAKIEGINNALDNPLFNDMKSVEEKKRVFQEKKKFVVDLRSQLVDWQADVNNMQLPELTEPLKEDGVLKTQHERATAVRNLVASKFDESISELDTVITEIDTALSGWMPEYEKVAEAYTNLLKEIGGDQENKERERQQLEGEKETFETDANTYRAMMEGLDDLWQERTELLDQIEATYQNKYEQRLSKFTDINHLSEGKLDLVLEHASDRKVYQDNLLQMLRGGQNAPGTGIRRQIAQNVMPRRFVELIIDKDVDGLVREAEITELWAQRVIDKLWSHEDFREVLALQHNCYPGDVPSIHFRKESGEYGELNELSVGQKCTALLIIALCDGTMPVVIDQPEDALDIISVWEDISKKLRQGKISRQFILTTHNSSVAVSADADQFIVLRAGAETGRVVYTGAIDSPEVRDSVLKHLEGGEEPYLLRARKYNLSQDN
jgi:hypothetical protein